MFNIYNLMMNLQYLLKCETENNNLSSVNYIMGDCHNLALHIFKHSWQSKNRENNVNNMGVVIISTYSWVEPHRVPNIANWMFL